MRYENWDVLLFPGGREHKTPFKEFRVNCNVMPETEPLQHPEAPGVPVMNCHVPSLDAGAHFSISVHSWTGPEISQATKSYSKHADLARFEARVLIDGQLVAHRDTVFDQEQTWPYLVKSTCELTKSGEPAQKRLKFPSFKEETWQTSHWNASVGMGKIVVIISEGFSCNSLTPALERVKNVVAFSFTYAPLELLENHGIAWPNTSMWRQASLRTSQLPVPTYYPGDGSRSHAHSPRQRSSIRRPYPMVPHSEFATGVPQAQGNPFYGNPGFSPGLPDVSRVPPGYGQFVTSETLDYANWQNWMNAPGASYSHEAGVLPTWPLTSAPMRRSHQERTSSSDQTNSSGDAISEMSGIAFQFQHNRNNGTLTPMHISGPSLEDDDQPPTSMLASNDFGLRVPNNTNTTNGSSAGARIGTQYGSIQGAAPPAIFSTASGNPGASFLTPDFARTSSSLTHSLLNQPLSMASSKPLHQTQPQDVPLSASEIKPRAENRLFARYASNPTSTTSTPRRELIDTLSQPPPKAASNTARGIAIFDTSVSPLSEESLSGAASPASGGTTVVKSKGGSRSESGTGFSSNLASLRTGISTPMAMRRTSASSLNSGELGASGNRKRCRNDTPSSSKAIEQEDQQPRPSPHLRSLGFGMADAQNM